MDPFSAASLALGVVGLIGGAQTARIQARASAKQAEEATKQSKAKQEELNANSELARSLQKINNDRIMRAADKTYAAAATNLSRNRAAAQVNNVMQQMANAEATGAYAANVASKGIGGGSVEVIENTMALRDSLKTRLTQDAQQQADYDAVQTLAGIIPAGWQQQDMTVLSGNQSTAVAVPTVQGGFNWAAALGNNPALLRGGADFLSGLGSKSAPTNALALPSGPLGSGTYGMNDYASPTFFSSTPRL